MSSQPFDQNQDQNPQPSRDFNFLTFPLTGSQLIEASAGTGKTFSLALLYTRLVLGHGGEVGDRAEADGNLTDCESTGFHRPLTPKEILVVTFTDAAAEELRDRIRARLVEAAVFFQDQETERDPFDP
ncbi:UvrD-helicase domain-containing protein, partial [Oceanospirillum sp. HFRX-1_2]